MQQPSRPTIVGIGASAGGIDALQEFFRVMPVDTGAAFVVVVHLDLTARSALAETLAARTLMAVTAVANALPLEGNHVYVTSPNQPRDHRPYAWRTPTHA